MQSRLRTNGPKPAMACCHSLGLWLTSGLPGDTWLRLGVWLLFGLVIYFFYGMRHSRLANATV
jgi:hypothetical protein